MRTLDDLENFLLSFITVMALGYFVGHIVYAFVSGNAQRFVEALR